ncbi:MAG: hypothetical protein V1799_06175 [bacterium]
MKYLSLLFLFGLLTILGCSGTSSASREASDTYSENIGTATALDIKEKTRKFFTKFNFEILRYTEDSDMISFESSWKLRSAMNDEVEKGFEEGRIRLFIQASPRRVRQTDAFSDLHVVKFTVENQVRYITTQKWVNAPITPMVRAYLKKLSDELTMEFRTGIRQF